MLLADEYHYSESMPYRSGFTTYSADYTVGGPICIIHHPCTIRGIRYVTMDTSEHTLRFGLWHPDGTKLRDKQVTVPAGSRPTVVECIWDTPYEPSKSDIGKQGYIDSGKQFYIGVYEGTQITRGDAQWTWVNASMHRYGWCWHGINGGSAGYITATSRGPAASFAKPDYTGGGLAGTVAIDPIITYEWDTDTPTPYVNNLLYGEYATEGGTLEAASGNRTCGMRSDEISDVGGSINGIRFYTAVSGSHTITAKLWRDRDGALLKSKQVNCSGPGTYDAVFDSPYVISEADFIGVGVTHNAVFSFTVREDSGTYYTRFNLDSYNKLKIRNSTYYDHIWHWSQHLRGSNSEAGPRQYYAGDAIPNTADTDNRYPVDLIYVPSYQDNPGGTGDEDYGPLVPTWSGQYSVSYQAWASLKVVRGARFIVPRNTRVYGVRVYNGCTSSRSFEIKLWLRDGPPHTQKAVGSVTVPAQSWAEGYFGTPYDILTSEAMGYWWEVTAWQTTDQLYWTRGNIYSPGTRVMGACCYNARPSYHREGTTIIHDQPSDQSTSYSWLVHPLLATLQEGYDYDPPVIDSNSPVGTISIPDPNILFSTKDVGGSGVDSSTIDCTVNGEDVIINGVFQTGWEGPFSAITSNAYNGYDVVIDKEVPLEWYTDYDVYAYCEDEMAFSDDLEWSFRIEGLYVVSVEAIDEYTFELTYNIAVKQVSQTDQSDALNPLNYTIVGGFRELHVSSVAIKTSAVVLLTVLEQTDDAEYTIIVNPNVTDATGDFTIGDSL